MKTITRLLAVLIFSGWAGSASSQVPITDTVTVGGIEWAQPYDFANLTWNDVNVVCPLGVCSGSLTSDSGTWDMDGWTWAGVDAVNGLFNVYLKAAGVTGENLLVGPDFFLDGGLDWGPAFFDAGFNGIEPPTSQITGLGIDGWSSTTESLNPTTAYSPGLLYFEGLGTTHQEVNTENFIEKAGQYTNKGAWFYRFAADNTPTGTNVQTDLIIWGATATFDNVTIEGSTTIVPYSDPPVGAPTSISFEFNEEYFDVTTTAVFFGNVELCFTYNDEGLSLSEEKNLKLLHFNEVTELWEDGTLLPNDTVNNRICGTTTSFSFFAVGLPDTDGDGICDNDIDVTGVCNNDTGGPDNCRSLENPLQEDADGDGCGDECFIGGCLGGICVNR